MRKKDYRLGRYIFIRVSPSNNTHTPHFATYAQLTCNVEKDRDGNIVIKNIPMVNQGEKGYCVIATITSVLLYMGFDVNQYSINLYLINFTGIDKFFKTLKLPFRYYRVNMDCPPRDEIVKEYNKKKSPQYPDLTAKDLYERFSHIENNADMELLQSLCNSTKIFDDFKFNIKKYIDMGIPICWGIAGHVRMITGYNFS